MLLSDSDNRAEIDGGRVVLEPYDKEMVQRSGFDVRIDPYPSRSYLNFHRTTV